MSEWVGKRSVRWSVAVVSAAVIATVTGCAAGGERPADADGEKLSIVYLASATANGFSNAVWEGIQDGAQELGDNIEVTILDGQFDATVQFNQMQDIATSGQYQGAVTLLNDTVGSVPGVETLVDSDIVVSNVLNPVGPDLRSLEPQVDGLMNVISDPAIVPYEQAENVVEYCADIDPCRVVIIIGGLVYPFDQARYAAYEEVLSEHPNIEIVATGEANFDRDQGVTAMADILAANPEFDVLISGDQMTLGAEVALEQAGWDLESKVADGSLFITSMGAAKDGVAAVRAGRWNEVVANYPYTAGRLAIEQVVKTLRGEDVDTDIDLDTVGPVPLVLTKDVLVEYPDFKGEWVG